MSLNLKFLKKLSEKLFSDKLEREKFECALSAGESSLASEIEMPGGEKYQLDNSSLIAASATDAIEGKINSILDVCAAPGGKSLYAWKKFNPEFLLSNEAISKRIPMLISNLKRCGAAPTAVTCLDSKILALKYPASFDLVLVDAPCSGQSLLAKGEKAPGALNPATINLNSNRQKRIIANSAVCAAPGGYLVYMTCTFSPEENEKVCEWFLKKFPEFTAANVENLKSYKSDFTDIPCYRLYPQYSKGAGAFTVIFKRDAAGDKNELEIQNEKFAWKSF